MLNNLVCDEPQIVNPNVCFNQMNFLLNKVVTDKDACLHA